jgi:hypothetical protein
MVVEGLRQESVVGPVPKHGFGFAADQGELLAAVRCLMNPDGDENP